MDVRPDFFASVIEKMDTLVIIFDRQGQVKYFNQACQFLTGYSLEEAQKKPIWEFLLSSEDVGSTQSLITSLDYGVEAVSDIVHWVTHDGMRRTISWSMVTVQEDEDRPEYIVASGNDVTSRKQIEKLLEREQLLLRSLINSIPDLIFYKDVNGIYLGCNAAFEAYSGHGVYEISSGKTDADFYSPELAQRFLETDQLVLTSGKAVSYENWTKQPNGESILLETQKTPYYGPNGEVLGVIGICRDITKHRRNEDALRKATAEIEQLIASLSSILIVLSADIKVTQWNPSAQRILGISAKEAVGIELHRLSIQWDWQGVLENVARCSREDKPIFLDPMRFRRPDGSEGYLGISISPIHENANILSGYILLGADITEKRLLETQLTQAQKLKSIGQLAAGIAHEINTPIQYVGDNTYFVQDSFNALIEIIQKYEAFLAQVKQGQMPREMIVDIEAASKKADLKYLCEEIPLAIQQSLEGIRRVSDIVRAMKDFSHPGVLKKTPININRAVESTLTVARNEYKYVAEVQLDLAPDLPEVFCQPSEINQVFLNIIVNAAHAIGDVVNRQEGQKGLITVSTSHDEDWVEIRIRDSGTGIPDEIAGQIFEPFFTTKDVGKGTGQGLAIAYNIIEVKHGGKLTFETAQGKGTTFIIRLPIRPPEEKAPIEESEQ